MKIALTGVTGQLGHLVVAALLKKHPAQDIIALVRQVDRAQALKEQGLDVRYFDYDHPESLAPALENVDRLLLISGNEVGRRFAQHQNVIKAAQQAKVPYIAYTSLLHADDSALGLAEEHRQTEALIKNSGLYYTLLRNGWYTENYLAGASHAVEQGMLYGAAQQAKISSATRLDFAEAAAQVLIGKGHEQKTYELAGSASYTLTDLANTLKKVSGKAVIYQNLTSDDYQTALINAGLPPAIADVIVDADLQAIHGALYSESKDLEHLLGRPSTTLEVAVQQALSV